MKCKFIINVLKRVFFSFYVLEGSSFLGVIGFLVCYKWLWMVIVLILVDKVLVGMWLNCFLLELYL